MKTRVRRVTRGDISRRVVLLTKHIGTRVVWWPRTESDPEPETTPQGADRGGTLAQCGIVETLRNYDLPQNILGDLMPINVQAIYEQEQEINIRVSLISSNGGHFVFSLCPIEWGENSSCYIVQSTFNGTSNTRSSRRNSHSGVLRCSSIGIREG